MSLKKTAENQLVILYIPKCSLVPHNQRQETCYSEDPYYTVYDAYICIKCLLFIHT